MIRALGILLLAEFVAFGIFAPDLGFYHDDWFFLETVANAEGLTGAVAAFAESGGFWTRPMIIILFPVLLTIGGTSPLFAQTFLLSMDVLQGLLFYILLLRLTGSKSLSLTAAVFGLLAPSRAITHVWFSGSAQSVALVLVLASLVLHTGWLKSRRKIPWASQGLYLMSALTYESFVFLPLLLFGGLAARLRSQGMGWKRSLLSPFKDCLPYAATLALALAWQWYGVTAVFGSRNPKSVGLSIGHIFRAFGAGFECVTNRVLHMAWTSLIPLSREAGLWLLVLPLLGAVASSYLILKRGREENRRVVLLSAAGIAGAGFIGAYAPYALSSAYMPQIYGIMSRTNGAGAFITGLLVAMAAYGVWESRPRLARVMLSLTMMAFIWTDWQAGLEWKRSWALQKDILDQASSKITGLPQGSAVLLSGAPGYFGHAVVFDASYDFASALRLWSHRSDLRGNIMSARLHYDEKGAVERVSGADGPHYPYESTYVYDYGEDTLLPLTRRKQ